MSDFTGDLCHECRKPIRVGQRYFAVYICAACLDKAAIRNERVRTCEKVLDLLHQLEAEIRKQAGNDDES